MLSNETTCGGAQSGLDPGYDDETSLTAKLMVWYSVKSRGVEEGKGSSRPAMVDGSEAANFTH